MRARPWVSCLVGLALIATSAACAEESYRPKPTPVQAPVLIEVPVSGTVRDTRGTPIAGATVTAAVENLTGVRPRAVTDPDGRFALLVSLPRSRAVLSLFVSAEGYASPGWRTVYEGGLELSAEVRLQRRLPVSAGESVTSVLILDDPTWTVDTTRTCGPCQMVTFEPPVSSQPRIVSMTWTGDATPILILMAFDVESEFGEGRYLVGTQVSNNRIEATIPAQFSANAYVGIAGDSVVAPIPYEISVR
jgi:hypothetical protein